MKKNLNIAYLNGAEGMIRRGGASSGGSSGSGSGEASTIEYLDVSGLDRSDFMVANTLKTATLFRYVINGTVTAITPQPVGNDLSNCLAVGVDFSLEIMTNNTIMTIREGWMQSFGDQLDAIPRLTKEQFYSLE